MNKNKQKNVIGKVAAAAGALSGAAAGIAAADTADIPEVQPLADDDTLGMADDLEPLLPIDGEPIVQDSSNERATIDMAEAEAPIVPETDSQHDEPSIPTVEIEYEKAETTTEDPALIANPIDGTLIAGHDTQPLVEPIDDMAEIIDTDTDIDIDIDKYLADAPEIAQADISQTAMDTDYINNADVSVFIS